MNLKNIIDYLSPRDFYRRLAADDEEIVRSNEQVDRELVRLSRTADRLVTVVADTIDDMNIERRRRRRDGKKTH